MEGTFKPGAYGHMLLLRAVPGLAALGFCEAGRESAAGACLVLSVWSDVVLGWWTKRRVWEKGPSQIQIEGFVDFLCFVWAPARFAYVASNASWLILPASVFILAGAYRLARFNVEGLVSGGYRGLPVTYNGYLFPAAALLAHFARDGAWVFGIIFLAAAALMVSARFRVPEI